MVQDYFQSGYCVIWKVYDAIERLQGLSTRKVVLLEKSVQYNTVLYNTVQYYKVQWSAVQYSAV